MFLNPAYFEFTNQFHTKKGNHSFREMLYVDSGFITVEAENYRGVLRENQMIIHKSNETHCLSCPENEASNVIIIGFECENSELDSFSENPTDLNDVQKKLLTEIVKEGRNVFEPPYDIPDQKDMKKKNEYPFGSDQLIKIKLENLFIELIRNKMNVSINNTKDVYDDKTHEIARYINDNFREKIRLSELCFLFGTNSTTLCNRFKDSYGETIISYVNKLKIRESKKLMRSGRYNLTEISSIVGYSSVHYFSKIFKQYEKISPANYIKTIKSRLMV